MHFYILSRLTAQCSSLSKFGTDHADNLEKELEQKKDTGNFVLERITSVLIAAR
jgi:hypothetical protein